MNNNQPFIEKTVLITGSTDGIGKQTAFELAKKRATVILHGKEPDKLKKTATELKETTNNDKIDYIKGDFTFLEDIKKMSDNIKERYGKIDVLINNAGLFSHKKIITKDGFELNFQVNYLAHFYLTYLLFEILKSSLSSRIINVSSMAHSSEIDIDNLQGEKQYNGYRAYSYTKLLNILFTFELAERTKHLDMSVNCLHPGVIDTKLLRAGWGLGGSSVSRGAITLVHLATSDKVNNITGKYFSNNEITNPAPIANNEELRRKVWKISEDFLNIKFNIEKINI